ncbi:hypothetical protein [Schlesneria sp. T3-172]|uniref:hypothetical protein n=1 Tax=Schlesneria sphaerica TaxID=3373610 RepID=UPI0037CA75C8
MSATAIISTATPDRVGDVLIPRGCQLENYAKNPVVLWGHGLEDIKVPIATSNDPSGRLSIRISDHEVKATSYFSQRNREAAQIFALIDEGIVRSTSVRETPIKARKKYDKTHGELLIVDEWELEEWSWCAIGVNPDAVAKAMNSRIDGRKLSPSIMKSLMAVAPVPRKLGVGFGSGKASKMADDRDDDELDDELDESGEGEDYSDDDETAEYTSTDGDGDSDTDGDSDADDDGIPDDADESDDSAMKADDVDPNADALTGDDEDDSSLGSDEDDCKPHGQLLLGAVHSALKDLIGKTKGSMKPLENKALRSGLNSVCKSLDEQKLAIEGMHGEHYPRAKSLSEVSIADGDGSLDGSEMKSFLLTDEPRRYQVAGVAARLKALTGETSIPKRYRKMFAEFAASLTETVTQAKAFRGGKGTRAATKEDKDAAALQKMIDDAKAALKT